MGKLLPTQSIAFVGLSLLILHLLGEPNEAYYLSGVGAKRTKL